MSLAEMSLDEMSFDEESLDEFIRRKGSVDLTSGNPNQFYFLFIVKETFRFIDTMKVLKF